MENALLPLGFAGIFMAIAVIAVVMGAISDRLAHHGTDVVESVDVGQPWPDAVATCRMNGYGIQCEGCRDRDTCLRVRVH